MANETSLPRQNSDIAGGNNPTREWYNFFRRLTDRVSAVENAPPVASGNSVTNIYGFDGLEKTVQDASTARTLTADDNLVNVEFTSASAITVTVNKDTLPENSITYLTQGGAGQVTVVAGTGVTIDYSDSLKTRTQESMIGLKQIQVNKFELFGDAEPVAPARSALIRSANSVGAPAFVSPTADGQVLKRSSGTLVFGALTAAEVSSTATGSVAATNVQAAIAELEAEKQPLDTQLTTIAGLTLTGQAGKALKVNSGGTDFELGAVATDLTAITTDVKLTTAGNGLYIAEGTNATMGVATLVAGTKVVSTTKVTANSRIFNSIQSLGTVSVPKAIGVTARTAGTSFTLTSADATDTSVIAWHIIEPIITAAVTWNSADKASEITLSGSDLIATRSSANNNAWRNARATNSRSTGKCYFEISNDANGAVAGSMLGGLAKSGASLTDRVGIDTNSWGLQANNGSVAGRTYYNNIVTDLSGLSILTAGQVMRVAVDFDAGKIWFGTTSAWSGDPGAGTGEAYTFTPNTALFPVIGQYSASQANTGKFKAADLTQSVPSGFSAWE